MGLRIQEILLILVVLLLLFGATRLPQLGASLGAAIKNFKRGFTTDEAPPADEKKGAPTSLASNSTVDEDAKARDKATQKTNGG